VAILKSPVARSATGAELECTSPPFILLFH
jgi:hypothetical protein